MKLPPSPATVAEQYSRRQPNGTTEEMVHEFQSSFPEVARSAERFGLKIRESIERWEETFSQTGVQLLLSTATSRFELAKWIFKAVARNESRLPLLGLLVVEERLHRDPLGIAGYLKNYNTSLSEVYLQLAERLGEAFLDAAFDATWWRRAVFSRALEAAGAYLSFVREAAELSNLPIQRSIQTRLGISTVLAARFGPVKEESLRAAHKLLLEAHDQGAEHAFTYYLEASNWLFDLYGDHEAIRKAASNLQHSAHRVDAARSLAVAHVWLRLAGTASSTGREAFIKKGLSALQYWPEPSLEDIRKEEYAAKVLLIAMFHSLRKQSQLGYRQLETRRILFPFGLRRPDTSMPVSFYMALPDLIKALDNSELCNDYVFRDLRAGLRSFLARSPVVSAEDAVLALEEALSLREGRPGYLKPLLRPEIEIDIAEDRFLLADLAKTSELRRTGVRELLRFATSSEPSARHLTALAREIDEHGPLRGAVLDGPDEIVFAVRSGDTKTLFEAAARAAYQSADLTRVKLGGRGGTLTLRDSDGLAGQTFVFKETSSVAHQRDQEFTSLVQSALQTEDNLEQRFGLIEHIAVLEPMNSGSGSDPVVSVRRYANGTILSEFLQFQSATAAADLLKEVAEFLAFIHWSGEGRKTTSGMRRELREREPGRWLRSFVPLAAERDSLFNAWWDTVSDAPCVPRRDAHAMNWIVDADGRILAVDLESIGSRPFGYEVAQLIEDIQVFEPTDWEPRREIMRAYSSAWCTFSKSAINESDAFRFYDAGALARAARTISNPASSTHEKHFAGRVFEAVSSFSNDARIADLSNEFSQHWRELTGNVGEVELEALTNAGRRRISRAMSYHLRHNKTAPRMKDGWMHVEELTSLLRASGHRVSSRQLLLIAGALGESRFELESGTDIRAVYGHSTQTDIPYTTKRPPEVLYHATPLRNLASIFEARAGLLRGKRNWVHMTDSCAVALNASRRQGSAIAVLEIDANSVVGLVHATDTTWLAPAVDVESIRLVPIRTVQELVGHGSKKPSPPQ